MVQAVIVQLHLLRFKKKKKLTQVDLIQWSHLITNPTYFNVFFFQCKSSCERSELFICRGFTWISRGKGKGGGERGLCDLHSEDLITTGSWLLRRISTATYYRRVVCLNSMYTCIASCSPKLFISS